MSFLFPLVLLLLKYMQKEFSQKMSACNCRKVILLHKCFYWMPVAFCRRSPSEMSLGKGVLKICCKFTGEHPCRSVISIKLQRNFIEITLRHGCSPVNLLLILRTPFPVNTSGGLLLVLQASVFSNSHVL